MFSRWHRHVQSKNLFHMENGTHASVGQTNKWKHTCALAAHNRDTTWLAPLCLQLCLSSCALHMKDERHLSLFCLFLSSPLHHRSALLIFLTQGAVHLSLISPPTLLKSAPPPSTHYSVSPSTSFPFLSLSPPLLRFSFFFLSRSANIGCEKAPA